MRTRIFTLFIFITTFSCLKATENITVRGYVKEMPGVRLSNSFSDPAFDNLIHNRLNLRWDLNNHLRLVAEGRNRIIYNPLFADYPFFADILAKDDGLMDLSWNWLNNGRWVGNSEIDRIFMDYRHNDWQFRVGRQRINWGINLVSNPNDLFNTYSFFDFDYEERPGADALRIQYNMGFASRVEAAYSPARDGRQSVGALMWVTNHRGYDFQILAGYYRHRSAVGFGWAGNIGGAGFKGEATWFQGLDNSNNNDIVAATGVDYMFSNGTFGVLEFLYNGGYRPLESAALLLNQPLSADNIMFSEYAITLSLQHPFSPVLSGGMAIMSLPDQQSFFISPSLSYSLMTNWDLDFISQIFAGGRNTIFEEAGSAWYVALKYSF
ncbi:hypothetical protein [Natronoflexus pectinivorans]|uniref:Alginate export domain-containing protein n=1 Tax=Natronoflexus pectinivorans TaxID=682526 RepID=A0A4R2GLJ0_9BACT|nr:hypothetical protein [Natronoflexus pectinivorans]TCO09855.1 hypothetical protein EV194_102284 [Natronoflexus pectinivorans]